jgi:hypothetical protein
LRNAAPVVPGFSRPCLPSSIIGFFYGAFLTTAESLAISMRITESATKQLQSLKSGCVPFACRREQGSNRGHALAETDDR